MPSGERETERFLKDSLETERFLRDSLEIPRPRTPQPRIYYTCMNSWMQLGLLRDLLHLHELVNGNLAFISDRSVLPTARPLLPTWIRLRAYVLPIRVISEGRPRENDKLVLYF